MNVKALGRRVLDSPFRRPLLRAGNRAFSSRTAFAGRCFPSWIRGWMNMLSGGSGIRRGRRHPEELHKGDALDFWRVLEVSPPNRLVKLAEMRLPGEATLEFRVTRTADAESELQQVSTFLPRGLFGILYWWAFYPVHVWLFRGMLRSIARRLGKPVVAGPVSFDPSLDPCARCG